MRSTWRNLHLALILVWGTTALVLAIGVAVLGGEEAGLTRSRGADRQAQLELVHRRDRLASEVERAASPARIEAARRELGLAIAPPLQVAAIRRPRSGE